MQTVPLGMSINGLPLNSSSTSISTNKLKLPFPSRLSLLEDEPSLFHPSNSGTSLSLHLTLLAFFAYWSLMSL